MAEQTLTDEFGVMVFDAALRVYETDIPLLQSDRVPISIAADEFEPGIKQMSAFLAWLKVNDRSFKLSLEQAIQNHDLVWDDLWDSILGADWIDAQDGFLSPYLSYKFIQFSRGAIRLWVDTAGLHTDHQIRVTIDAAMQIQGCEMM